MKMELISVALTLVLVTIVTWAWRILNWVWIRPKKLEISLRKQGLAAKPYRLLFGDTREDVLMVKEAKSRPFSLSDNVASRIVPFLEQTIKTYGKASFVWIGPVARVNITNPEHIRDVLTRINEFGKVNISNPFWKMLPSGVAGYEGQKWAKHRKIINPAFHVEKLKLMIPVFYQTCNEMINKWEALVSMNGRGTCEVDVWPYLQNLSCDIIARTAFGSNYEEGKIYFISSSCKETLYCQQSCLFIYQDGGKFLPTKRNRRMKAVNREIEESLKVIIDKREKAINAGKGAKDDLLGILMESNLMEMQNNGNKVDKGMSNKDVLEECKVFYFAGQETSSSLLVWTLVLLSHYPYWQETAREEVIQVFGKNKPDFDGLNRLKVVTMILYEVLRLYPAIIMLNRRVKEETKLGNLTLPAGSMVSIPAVLVHQDPELWGDDAAEFNPNRFSEGVANATKNRVIFFPFGWGPRICLGQNFALVEAKIALVTILQHFSFELSTSYVHAPCLVVSLKPQYGAQIILHKC